MIFHPVLFLQKIIVSCVLNIVVWLPIALTIFQNIGVEGKPIETFLVFEFSKHFCVYRLLEYLNENTSIQHLDKLQKHDWTKSLKTQEKDKLFACAPPFFKEGDTHKIRFFPRTNKLSTAIAPFGCKSSMASFLCISLLVIQLLPASSSALCHFLVQ